MRDDFALEPLLTAWRLVPDGAPIVTRSSQLLPVRRGGVRAMLKYTGSAEEARGGRLMQWWDGVGAARVLARRGAAVLLEWAEGGALSNQDDDTASRILCQLAARLHAPRDRKPPRLVGLARWFRALAPAAARHGGILAQADVVARDLLAHPRDEVVLHGDLHHGNILDFGPRGWLAIDPKGLLGERGFDHANLFRNPDPATAPGRLAHRADIVAEAAGLERDRLLRWVLAVAGLSAAWNLSDGLPAEADLAVARAAIQARR